MSVERARLIDGWMGEAELAWLFDRSSGLRLVVEFGSWCGRSSVALSGAARVLCCDTWRGSQEHAELFRQGANPLEAWQRNASGLPSLVARRIDLASERDVSRLVAEVQSLGGAEMVFIDAAHDYESVSRDIATARRLLVPGGLLSGHDYSDYWPDVRRAVDETIPHREVVESIWWATMP